MPIADGGSSETKQTCRRLLVPHHTQICYKMLTQTKQKHCKQEPKQNAWQTLLSPSNRQRGLVIEEQEVWRNRFAAARFENSCLSHVGSRHILCCSITFFDVKWSRKDLSFLFKGFRRLSPGWFRCFRWSCWVLSCVHLVLTTTLLKLSTWL